MEHSPNFLTCPAVPELPSPKETDSSVPEVAEELQGNVNKPFIPLRPQDDPQSEHEPPEPKFQTHVTPPKKNRKKYIPSYVILIVLILLGVLFIPPLIALGRAGYAGYQAKLSLESMQYMLEIGELESAQSEASVAQTEFTTMHKYLSGVGFWRDMPYVGTQIRGLQDTAQISAQTLDGVQDILEVAAALQEALFIATQASTQTGVHVDAAKRLQELTAEERYALLESLYRSLPEIRLARDKIDIALSMWNDLSKEQLAGPIRSALEPMTELLPVLQKSLEQGVPLIEVFVPLLGYPDPQTYVIVTQNADEIRPAGGFIGSVVAANVNAGNFDDYEFYDIYSIDNPASGVWSEIPPAPIEKHLGVTKWFMRDANWSPDFPTSAERLLDFYERERAIPLGKPAPHQTGFIALEPGFFESLLSFTGPVIVDGKTFNAANFMDVLQYEVEVAPDITQENRKDLMGDVADEIVAKIQALPRSDWPKLLNIITTALNQKQILIYNRDPEIQSLVDARNWSGRTKPTIGDFLWVIDANLAALKTDGVMNKSIQYTLDARDFDHPRANVTLTYHNTNNQITWRYTRYRSYTRVYVPEGSQLISSSGAMSGDLTQTGGRVVPGQVDVMKELGKTVFGAFWAIEPGRTGKLAFTYELPKTAIESMLDGTYRLDWPKQPGVDNAEFNVKILFPQSIKTATPAEPQDKWGDTNYEVQAGSLFDQVFKVELE
jgi:Protein of unknown function (DUF4012)